MGNAHFVHLHVHTEYSLLDSSIRIENLIKKTKELGMSAVAITDHGSLSGAVKFYIEAKKNGIKPIIGCEVYVATKSRFNKSSKEGLRDASHHLILLAETDVGYKNLVKLVSAGYLEGFYHKPRIDKELLAKHCEGLIALSSCVRGEVGENLRKENRPRAEKIAKQYKEIMGEENYFLELQYHGLEDQEEINKGLAIISEKLSIPLVATNNCLYLNKSDAMSHEVLLCLQTGKTISDPYRMQYPANEFYFKSADEMNQIFDEHPVAMQNTLAIAERCNVNLDFTKKFLPYYVTPQHESYGEYLNKIALTGLKPLLNQVNNQSDKNLYTERLDRELDIIKKMGVSACFLVVWDLLTYAKNNNVLVGPRPGPITGSLVSYALKITKIDPIEHGLSFEPFLNPEQTSLPVIDIGICKDQRERVLDYLTKKHGGSDYVAQVMEFERMNGRKLVRAVGRVLEISRWKADKVAMLIPNLSTAKLTDVVSKEKKFAVMMEKDLEIKKLIDTALDLEGLLRNYSKNVSGVIISPSKLTDYVPLYKGKKRDTSTQFEGDDVKNLGLLKIGFFDLDNPSSIV